MRPGIRAPTGLKPPLYTPALGYDSSGFATVDFRECEPSRILGGLYRRVERILAEAIGQEGSSSDSPSLGFLPKQYRAWLPLPKYNAADEQPNMRRQESSYPTLALSAYS